MFDPVTLDQLRAFATVVEEGSFSAAARRLKRVQSAVSTAMANLEAQLGVTLWDRSTKIATLTEQGQAVLGAARRVLAEVDDLKRLAAGLSTGLEASVSLCVDALFPLAALIALSQAFAEEFPSVDLRIDTQVMSAVSLRVLRGEASLGVVAPPGFRAGLERQPLATVRMVPVVAPSHALAARKERVPQRALTEAVQIVLSERSDAGVADQAVLSSRTWRVADLHTKHALLRAGLGWGNLPEHLVHEDLVRGTLVAIRPATWAEAELELPLFLVHRSDFVFGPAHRWVRHELERLCALHAEQVRARRSRKAGHAEPRGTPAAAPKQAPGKRSKGPSS